MELGKMDERDFKIWVKPHVVQGYTLKEMLHTEKSPTKMRRKTYLNDLWPWRAIFLDFGQVEPLAEHRAVQVSS